MEGDHNFHIGSGEVEVRTRQVVLCGNDVKGVGVVAVVAQCARTNNCHGCRTEHDQMVVGSGKVG